jgi:uncharacterized protein YdeI (YjbR/CyaY-like superfamily)
MATKNPKVDTYIAKSGDFAKPILTRLRELVHKACPDVEETIKWGMPSFDYKGPFCSMAAFKEHAVFGFWKASLLNDPKKYLQARSTDGGSAMGHFGRLTSIKDLPPDKVILDFIKQHKKLNDEGIKVPAKPKPKKKELVIPAYFLNAIKKNKKALAVFNEFSYSHQKDYVEWITEAKTEATRNKRMETAIEWMAEGKGRNWKYQRK